MSPSVVAAGPGSAGRLHFELPGDLVATEPPEVVGEGRDDVRMLVARRSPPDASEIEPFARLPELLETGDLVVVNTSATLPAALPAQDGLLVHLSGEMPDGRWLVELRRACGWGSLPHREGRAGQSVEVAGGGRVELRAAWPAGQADGSSRLWVADLIFPRPVGTYLAAAGRPIRYGCQGDELALSAYQTFFALDPGSAEMPSAGRPFTAEMVTALARRGIGVAPITLHTGVSSPEAGEPPVPERYRVPASTAAAVNAARGSGHRVLAVGTTVTRALESATGEDGHTRPSQGWTDLVIDPVRGVRAVDGLLTGWHEPESSHLLLLEAVAGRPTLEHSYAEALRLGLRWHELGDLWLVMP